MDASRSNYPHGSSLKVAVTVAYFIISPLFLSLKSDGFVISGQSYADYDKSLVQKKMMLGSKPPACVNKCLNCRPCIATLVIPPHQKKSLKASSSSHGEDDNYYLLSWKCRCGNKLFQP